VLSLLIVSKEEKEKEKEEKEPCFFVYNCAT
jgi:hypothetical protein